MCISTRPAARIQISLRRGQRTQRKTWELVRGQWPFIELLALKSVSYKLAHLHMLYYCFVCVRCMPACACVFCRCFCVLSCKQPQRCNTGKFRPIGHFLSDAAFAPFCTLLHPVMLLVMLLLFAFPQALASCYLYPRRARNAEQAAEEMQLSAL